MSVPRSSVLSCSKRFLAKVGTNLNSPKQSQNQNVNVVVNPYERVPVSYPDVKPISPEEPVSPGIQGIREQSSEARTSLGSEIKERSVETADETLANLEKVIHDKDMLIQASVLCLDIVENNPLIVNKYVIAAEENELMKLIQLLCDTEEVELLKADQEAG
ncbi:hypothetical protein GPJ56_006496 [Histomonas meleagridis]|nr:hypothetical protein GPJ56_006496 [Histomonas meleagridis]